MATTYNCAIQNLGGKIQPQTSGDSFFVGANSSDALYLQFGNASDFIMPSTRISPFTQITSRKGGIISFLENIGYLDVSESFMRFYGIEAFQNGSSVWRSVTEFEDGSVVESDPPHTFEWPSGLSSPVSDLYLIPLSRIDIEFSGRFGEEQVVSQRVHTINLTGYENVRLRTGIDAGNFFSSLGFDVNSLDDYPAIPTIICEEVQDGESTGTTTTVTFSEQFMTSTANTNTITNTVQNNTGDILKEFKAIQDAHAAGTLDVGAANETLTNLYNEL